MGAPACIKRARALLTTKGRCLSGRFLVEGLRAVLDALLRTDAVVEVILSEEGSPETADLIRRAVGARAIAIHLVRGDLMQSVSAVTNSQGVLATVLRPQGVPAGAPLLPTGSGRGVVIDRVSDPGNLGTILRSADALGCESVIVTPGCVDPYNPKVVRSAVGSLLTRAPRSFDAELLVERARVERVSLLLLDAGGGHSVGDYEPPERYLLVAGGEAHGACEVLCDNADVRLHIPLHNRVESLNVAIALSIALFELS